jgi:hypothetical protein
MGIDETGREDDVSEVGFGAVRFPGEVGAASHSRDHAMMRPHRPGGDEGVGIAKNQRGGVKMVGAGGE